MASALEGLLEYYFNVRSFWGYFIGLAECATA